MPSLTPRAVLLGSLALLIPAIGSVLGGASNSIVDGLVAGILVTALAWQIGSVATRRRLHEAT
jgi:large-conductance mechanosensitive channel